MLSSQNSQVSEAFNYIEDVFSTYLYTGNGSTQTITNGVNLASKGGLVWGKSRSNAYNNFLVDSTRGITKFLTSDETRGQQTDANVITAFNSNGFSLGAGGAVSSNNSGATFASWTFRKQAKFFDVVPLTQGVTTYNHNLESTPGCIIVKCTSANGANWVVYHRSLADANNKYLTLNLTNGPATFSGAWSTSSTQFSVASGLWANGTDGIAYLFAHDAGGFGLTGTDNVISCGTFNGSTAGTVNLGFEPQFVLVKDITTGFNWVIYDTMREMAVTGASYLFPNATTAEGRDSTYFIYPTATGFGWQTNYGTTAGSVYIAIRRGPMKVPTLGTSVFATSKDPTYPNIPSNILVDSQWFKSYGYAPGEQWFWFDRLRQGSGRLSSSSNDSESSGSLPTYFNMEFGQTGTKNIGGFFGSNYIAYQFRRAPGFFDEVCFTGAGAALTVNHNLGATPELIIIKRRDGISFRWKVTSSVLTDPNTYYLTLDDTAGQTPSGANFIYNRTSTTFSVYADIAQSGWTWVSYLFATCPGVSKVGSYTGTGALQTVNCGFTSGARFVLIKRIDSGSNWYVWDSARGITSGNDPYLLLDTTAAEVTSTNYVDTDTTGFKVTAAAPIALNASGGTYLFLAIA